MTSDYIIVYEHEPGMPPGPGPGGRMEKIIRFNEAPQVGDIIELDEFTHLEVVRRLIKPGSGAIEYIVRRFKRTF